jgi:hypothetical protein
MSTKKTWLQAILSISNFRPSALDSEVLLTLFNSALRHNYMHGIKNGGHAVAPLVEATRYKPEGGRFDSR